MLSIVLLSVLSNVDADERVPVCEEKDDKKQSLFRCVSLLTLFTCRSGRRGSGRGASARQVSVAISSATDSGRPLVPPAASRS